jgi:urease accessory protein
VTREQDQPPVVVARLPDAAASALADEDRDTAWLTAAERQWPRRSLTTERGRLLTLALPAGARLTPGQVLHVEPGWWVRLEAALEPVFVVVPRTTAEAVRIALEVGGQHGALAIDGEHLLVPDDPVLQRLLIKLEVPWSRARRAFVPISQGTPHSAHRTC